MSEPQPPCTTGDPTWDAETRRLYCDICTERWDRNPRCPYSKEIAHNEERPAILWMCPQNDPDTITADFSKVTCYLCDAPAGSCIHTTPTQWIKLLTTTLSNKNSHT